MSPTSDKTIAVVSAKVVPDLDEFRKEAKAKLDAEEKRLPDLEVEIHVKIEDGAQAKVTAEAKVIRETAQAAMKDLELKVNLDDTTSLQHALAQIDAEIRKIGEIEIPVGLNETDLKAMRELIQERLRDVGVDIKVNPDSNESIEKAIARINAELNNIRSIDLNVDLNEASLEAAKELLQERFAENVKVDIVPDVSAPASAVASGQLAILTRLREVEIRPVIDKAGLAAISFVSVLSGFDALKTNIDQARTAFLGLFTNLPLISALTPVVLGLAGAFLSSAANLTTLAASAAQALPVLLALPGIAIGVGTMVLAFQDFGNVLPEVVSQFKELQPLISGAFWAEAKAPIAELASVIFPQLREGLEGTAGALGGFFSALSGAIAEVLGEGTLTGWFASLTESIQIFTGFTEPLANIFKIFGDIGSTLLPLLAQYFGELAERFSVFMEALVSGAGGLGPFVEQTMAAFKGIIEFVLSLGNVFASVFASATAAGGATFQSLADHLNTFAEFLKQPEIAAGMTALFASAFTMFENFFTMAGPALQAFMTGFGAILTNVLPQVGTVLGGVAQAIGAVFNNEQAMAGLQAFITGVLTGLQAVLPALAPLGDLIAALGPTLGLLATQIGTVFGALAPSFGAVITSLQPIITLLGTGLADVLTSLSPVLTTLGTGIATIFGSLAPVLAPILAALMSVINALVGPLMSVINALVPLITAILAAVGPIITILVDALAPILVQIVTALAPIIDLITQLITLIAPVLIPVIQLLADILGGALGVAIDLIVGVIGGLLEILTGVIKFVVGVFAGDWGMAWEGIKGIFKGIWDAIVAIFEFVLGSGGFLLDILGKFVGILGDLWSGLWNGISSVVSDAWNWITGVVSGAIDAVVGFFLGLSLKMGNAVREAFDAVKEFFTNGMNAARDAVSDGISAVLGFFGGLGGRIWTALGDLGQLLLNVGGDLMSGLANGVRNGATAVIDAIKNFVLDKIPGFVKDFFGIHSPSTMFAEFGSFLMLGLAEGIEDEATTVMRALKGVMRDVEGVQFKPPSVALGLPSLADGTVAGSSTGNTMIYHAASGSSLGSEEELFQAVGRARAFGW